MNPNQPEPSTLASLIAELREAADVAYKGPHDTDPAMLRLYADKIRRGYPGGGSNLTAAVARVLDVVADALLWQPAPPAEPQDVAPDAQAAIERADLVLGGFVQHDWASSASVHEWYLSELRKLRDAVATSKEGR